MANTQREVLVSPSTTDCVKITGAHTASLDLDVDIVIAERLWLELIQMEFGPFLRILNLETFERFRVNHCDSSCKDANYSIP